MLRKTAVLALVAALSVPVTFVAAAKPPGKGQITIAAAPNPINFGGSTGLTGKLTGSQAGGQARLRPVGQLTCCTPPARARQGVRSDPSGVPPTFDGA